MYERKLLEYLPPFLQEIKEIQAILEKGEEPEIEALWLKADDALADQFIPDATENGVSRWEAILGIVPKAGDSLEARKFTILTRINEQLPFTMTTLKEQLQTLCGKEGSGFSVRLDENAYTLFVLVALTAKSNLQDVDALLKRVVPANLIVSLGLKYNQHETLAGQKHGYWQAFTHDYLRNEVLSEWRQIHQTII